MTTAVEKVTDGQSLLALILRAEYQNEGIVFFTPDDFSQQLAYMNRPAGHKIQPHVHNQVRREVALTQEVLFIRKGSVRVDFYDNSRTYLRSTVLKTGDTILLASGGHGFEMLEASEMVEVKQGPYAGEMDKTRFNGINTNKSKDQ